MPPRSWFTSIKQVYITPRKTKVKGSISTDVGIEGIQGRNYGVVI